jgi:hypothetical protein
MISKSLRPGSEEVWSSGREAFVCKNLGRAACDSCSRIGKVKLDSRGFVRIPIEGRVGVWACSCSWCLRIIGLNVVGFWQFAPIQASAQWT